MNIPVVTAETIHLAKPVSKTQLKFELNGHPLELGALHFAGKGPRGCGRWLGIDFYSSPDHEDLLIRNFYIIELEKKQAGGLKTNISSHIQRPVDTSDSIEFENRGFVIVEDDGFSLYYKSEKDIVFRIKWSDQTQSFSNHSVGPIFDYPDAVVHLTSDGKEWIYATNTNGQVAVIEASKIRHGVAPQKTVITLPHLPPSQHTSARIPIIEIRAIEGGSLLVTNGNHRMVRYLLNPLDHQVTESLELGFSQSELSLLLRLHKTTKSAPGEDDPMEDEYPPSWPSETSQTYSDGHNFYVTVDDTIRVTTMLVGGSLKKRIVVPRDISVPDVIWNFNRRFFATSDAGMVDNSCETYKKLDLHVVDFVPLERQESEK